MRFEAVGRVILACQQAGILKVGFITEPPQAGRLAVIDRLVCLEGNRTMSMNVGNASGEGEVMVEMNTTPLIDVMLVLLTLLIITLPIQTHAVKLDMPTPNPTAADRHSGVGGTGRGLRRHRSPGTATAVDRATMDSYFADAARKDPQPEIHINPNRLAKYDAVAKVLADAQRLGATHIGFTGIDQYN